MIFKSARPDVSIPNQSLTEFVLERAASYGDRAALVDGVTGRTITYRQLPDLIRRAAAGLHAKGFRKGDVLALFSPNLPEYAVAFHAVSTLGGTNTTLNPLYTVDEIVKQLRDARARFILTIPPFMDRAQEAAEQVGIETIFVFGEAEGATSFASLLANDGTFHTVTIDPAEDVVALPYSSGTTGLPKGVMLTHRNLVSNLTQIENTISLGSIDTCIAVLPFFHIYGMTVILNMAVRKGATIVSLPRFELEPFLQAMQDHKVSVAFLVPPIVLALAKHPVVSKYDLSAVRVVMSGAAPLDDGVARACCERLGCSLIQGYGMTETSPVTHVSSDEAGQSRLGSVGPLVANTECRVVDTATGASVGVGERGEICVRGPQVMKGYLGNPAATEAMIDADGWLHTGDIGYADADGHFFVVDRVKELIKYKGFQVPPAELEAILLAHPAVADAAVIGQPDAEAGEVPKGFVVLRVKVDPAELMAHVAERVAPHKKLRAVEIVDQIPKSPTGKILRRVLVDRERAKAAATA